MNLVRLVFQWTGAVAWYMAAVLLLARVLRGPRVRSQQQATEEAWRRDNAWLN